MVRRAETLALVAVGGFAGATARHAVALALPATFPWGTLAVNAVGSLALGFVAGADPSSSVALLFGTGFCGAFTTFSTFAFETARLAETGRTRRAVGNAVVTLAGALLAVGAGLWLAGP